MPYRSSRLLGLRTAFMNKTIVLYLCPGSIFIFAVKRESCRSPSCSRMSMRWEVLGKSSGSVRARICHSKVVHFWSATAGITSPLFDPSQLSFPIWEGTTCRFSCSMCHNHTGKPRKCRHPPGARSPVTTALDPTSADLRRVSLSLAHSTTIHQSGLAILYKSGSHGR